MNIINQIQDECDFIKKIRTITQQKAVRSYDYKNLIDDLIRKFNEIYDDNLYKNLLTEIKKITNFGIYNENADKEIDTFELYQNIANQMLLFLNKNNQIPIIKKGGFIEEINPDKPTMNDIVWSPNIPIQEVRIEYIQPTDTLYKIVYINPRETSETIIWLTSAEANILNTTGRTEITHDTHGDDIKSGLRTLRKFGSSISGHGFELVFNYHNIGGVMWNMKDTKDRITLPGKTRKSVVYVRIFVRNTRITYGKTKYVKCAQSKMGYKTLTSAVRGK